MKFGREPWPPILSHLRLMPQSVAFSTRAFTPTGLVTVEPKA